MAHFMDEQWVDFLRLTAHSAEAGEMRRHLDEGCGECRTSYAVWQSVARAMSREQSYQCPEPDVRASEKAYSEWRWRFLMPRHARVARLVFDSSSEPAIAGVRGSPVASRRLLQRAGRWSIDLRLEPEPDDLISLDGQILKAPGKSGPGAEDRTAIQIGLMTGASVLSHTFANKFGEFQLRFKPAPDLWICFDLPNELPIAVRLPAPG